MKLHRTFCIAGCALLATLSPEGQVPLPEQAAKIGQPFTRPLIRELVPITIEELAKDADLIVHGIVTPLSTHLSDNRTEIYTDYVIATRRVIDASAPATGARATPGPVAPTKFTAYGGTMVFDGIRVECIDQSLPAIDPGTEAVLFLKGGGHGEIYHLVGEIAVFKVHDGRMIAPNHDLKLDWVQGMTVSDFASRIVQAHRR